MDARKDILKRFRDGIGKEGYGMVYAKQLRQQIQEEVIKVKPFTQIELLEILGEAEVSFQAARSTAKAKANKASREYLEREAEAIKERGGLV